MERNLPDTGEAGASRNYPDTGEPEPRRNYPDTGEAGPRFQEEPVVLEPVVPEEAMLVPCQSCGAKISKRAHSCPKCGRYRMVLKSEESEEKEPLWLTVWYTIFGLGVVSLLLYGLWLFIRS